MYQPGTLEVKAYKKGKLWAENSVSTTGIATGLKASADRYIIAADGEDLSFIGISVVDSKGRDVPTASQQLTFSLSGPGEIVATDNGDPTDLVSLKSNQRNAFNGKALAIVRGLRGEAGELTLSVTGNGLESTHTRIESRAVKVD